MAFAAYFRDAARYPSLVERTRTVYNQHAHASFCVDGPDLDRISDMFAELRSAGYMQYATFADFVEMIVLMSSCKAPVRATPQERAAWGDADENMFTSS